MANGASSNSSSTKSNAASHWPPFTIYAPYQIDLNQVRQPTLGHDYGPSVLSSVADNVTRSQTGGTLFQSNLIPGYDVPEYGEPGLLNNITLVNAWTWEAGRGFRCEFWRSVGAIVPE